MADWLRISRGSAWSLVFEKREVPPLRFEDRIVRGARGNVPPLGAMGIIETIWLDITTWRLRAGRGPSRVLQLIFLWQGPETRGVRALRDGWEA